MTMMTTTADKMMNMWEEKHDGNKYKKSWRNINEKR
jgi:hypothetical protein